ncbi:MAG: molybdopterin-dependent oxidoreductase, partial [Myxococcota bacterium]|nr:molybdopterin-dependent oxidoreductase [Myxococcota bacterium]
PTDQGPNTRSGHPLLVLQAPADALVPEIVTPGEGQVRALVCVSGNPQRTVVGGTRTRDALTGLDLLVCLTDHEDETAALADWVLPTTHPWEQADLHAHDSQELPIKGAVWTPALVSPAGEARGASEILADLFKATKPGLRGSAWGTHLGLIARQLATGSLETWETRLLDWAGLDRDQLNSPPHRIGVTESDRSPWCVRHEDERIDLFPEAIANLLPRLQAPREDPERSLFLRTSRTSRGGALHRPEEQRTTRAWIHPDVGFEQDAQVRVSTRFGEVQARVQLDETLRSDVVDLPLDQPGSVGALIGMETLDALSGTPNLDGLNCAILGL